MYELMLRVFGTSTIFFRNKLLYYNEIGLLREKKIGITVY